MKGIIYKALTVHLFLFSSLAASQEAPFSLQEKFSKAQDGDFVVTAQEGSYSLLFIRSITSDVLLLEEICIPAQQINLKKIDWKKWVTERAPGHTSWTLYEIDRVSGQLIECFSYSKNGWLYLDESEQFLSRLLNCPLYSVPLIERKKIGPSPAGDESDRRALWNPPLVIEGEKISKPTFNVMRGRWPEDGSRLSLCEIELYFAKDHPDFPFPYWLEVHSPHYTFKMRAIDSGHQLISPVHGPMPHRSPLFLGKAQRGKESWKLFIQTPLYFQKIQLFAIDLSEGSKTIIPIPFTPGAALKGEEIALEISRLELKHILKGGHKYQWALVPEAGRDIYVESEEIFIWSE